MKEVAIKHYPKDGTGLIHVPEPSSLKGAKPSPIN